MPLDDTTPNGIQQTWKERIQQAKDARKPHELTMLSDLAFAAGQHWLEVDPQRRVLRHISKFDPRYQGRELFTADRITEYRQAQLGELSSDDDRPQLVVAQDSHTADDAADQLNHAVQHAWEHEWEADAALTRARQYCVDLGVAAIRCRWNPDAGKTIDHHPVDPTSGQPYPADAPQLQELAQTGMVGGSLPRYKPVREGRTEWQAYSGLQLLPPPGVNHEDEFPWEILVGTASVDDVKAEYGQAAANLAEDGDIANVMGLVSGQEATAGQNAAQGRLRGQVWMFYCFQRPTKQYPDGRQAVLCSNQYVLLDSSDEFDYRLPDGRPHSGVVYLHWNRLSDRFWSRGFVTGLKDPQRMINRRETQNIEIIDRGMPAAYVEEGSLAENPTGAPMEHRPLKKGGQAPTIFAGVGPGPWMYQDLEHQAENLAHASTLSQVRLGENPPNADTYSALVLLNENDAIKRNLARIEHRQRTGTLVELGVYDIRRYWPDEKQILIAGDEEQIRRATFQKARIPEFYMVQVAKGAPQPRSQGAELKKIDAILQAAVETGLAVQAAQEWTDWYARSVDAGSMQELPEPPQDSQQEIARLENVLMRQGEPAPVAEYDNMPVHLPEHRLAMDQARASGDQLWYAALYRHVQEHIAQAQANAAKTAAVATQAPTPVPVPPPAGGPPGPPAGPPAAPGPPQLSAVPAQPLS